MIRYSLMTQLLWPRVVDEGARRLHLVDLNGAFDGVPVHRQVVNDITKATRTCLFSWVAVYVI